VSGETQGISRETFSLERSENTRTTTEFSESTEEDRDSLTQGIIGAAIAVHRALGPGLLESAYEACLGYELRQRGLRVEAQFPLPVVYNSVRLDCGCRLDLFVERQVIIEVKSVTKLAPIHEAQLLSYLKLARCKRGLLINFNEILLKDGVRRKSL
jgi:GxxExxY protein